MEKDKKGELGGRREGESVKRRRRVKVEHDRSSAVERKGEKRLWKNGKHSTIKEMKSSKKDML
jgi:hypothetical protein